MNHADVVNPSSGLVTGGLFCAGLFCLLVVSAIALTVVLYRRSRRTPPGDVS